MTMLPIRGVGDIGVVTDIKSYDLPITAWNAARNVRFRNKTISRSSVFKKLATSLTLTGVPIFVTDGSLNGDQGALVIAQDDGKIIQLENGVQTDCNPTPVWGGVASPVTSCRIGGVTYLNNRDGGPLYRTGPAAVTFARLPGWVATDRCLTIRAYKDFVLALNVNKGSTEYPNMVKWSNAVQNGAVAPDWDTASLSSLAGENIINDAIGELVDGLTLGNAFILYGSEETYRMNFIGTPLIFQIEKLFSDLGVPGSDCVVEIDGKHYVFGDSEIYIHDGMTKLSISQGKVNERIFSRIDYINRDKCFTFHNPRHNEIIFAYPSKSSDCRWTVDDTIGCNEGAVYNYVTGSWSFIDLPSVTAAVLASIPQDAVWDDLGLWSGLTGTWRSYEGSEPQLTILLSSGNPAITPTAHLPELYFYDNLTDGFLSNAVESRFLWPGFATTYIRDSDEFGGQITGTKLVNGIYPQVLALDPLSTLIISVGVTQTPYADVQYSPSQVFNCATDYKLDFRATGRYIALKIEWPADYDSVMSGYDLDVIPMAGR